MDYIAADHIRDWIQSGRAQIVDSEMCAAFHERLLVLPWLPTSVDWSKVSHGVVDGTFLTDDELLDQVKKFSIGDSLHIMIMFTPDQQGLVCSLDDAVKNLDLLYWKSPGARYFCAVDYSKERTVANYSKFGEFDGKGIVRLYTGSEL